MTTIYQSVQNICLELPQTSEVVSHSFPTFKVEGKSFATYSLNHHGDEKVSLILNIGIDTQQFLVDAAPSIFYVPPYSGPQGWVGIELNKGLNWTRVADLTLEAYVHVAPLNLSKNMAEINVLPPDEEMTIEIINPLRTASNQKIIKKLRSICLALPETNEDKQFGNPSFKAGKKTFATLRCRSKKLILQFWVGLDRQQPLVSFDQRFNIPAYMGHNGWIDMTLPSKPDWLEIKKMLMASYRHFALQRMVRALDVK